MASSEVSFLLALSMPLTVFFASILLATGYFAALLGQLIHGEPLDALGAILSSVMPFAAADRLLLMFTVLKTGDSTFVVALTVGEEHCLVVRLIILAKSGCELRHL